MKPARRHVYLDHAASTPLAPEVLEAMLPVLQGQYGNPSSIHHHGRQVRALLEEARKRVADLMGCAPAEIIFTSGGTEADNLALRGAVATGAYTCLITSPLEHHAVCHTLEALHRQAGLPLFWLTPNAQGLLDLTELEAILKANGPAVVSLMHGNNEIGTLTDLHTFGALCRQYGAFFHSDTVQTVGHQPLNLSSTPVDAVAAAAHKFSGPRGVGFLYVRSGAQVAPQLTGGGQERNMRAGTENVAGVVGLAHALDLSLGHLQHEALRLQQLKVRFMQQLSALNPHIQFNGITQPGQCLDTVLSVTFPGQEEESLLLFNLDIAGISASGGSACSSGSVSPSHVLSALGLPRHQVANTVRFSFGRTTTAEDMDYCLDVLAQLMPVTA